jgi:hypothetical protein
MPQSQSEMILDSITIDNIDDAMYFYSYILEKIIKKKKRYQDNEDIMMNQLKNLDIKQEVNRLKLLDECYASMDSDELETDSDECST